MSDGQGVAGITVPAPPEVRHLPQRPDGYDRAKVEEAFEAFRQQIAALQAEIYELKTEGTQSAVPLPGESSRAETLRLVQAGAELAQAIEQDARETAAQALARLEEEMAARRRELDERQAALEQERVQVLEAAETQARAQLELADRRAAEAVALAEARAEELLEHVRLEADELRAAAQDAAERALEEATARGRRAEPATAPVEERPEERPALVFRTPPLSPEDLAAGGSVTFRVEPAPEP